MLTLFEPKQRQNIWPHRLTARTPGFHPGNRSSILREVTSILTDRVLIISACHKVKTWNTIDIIIYL